MSKARWAGYAAAGAASILGTYEVADAGIISGPLGITLDGLNGATNPAATTLDLNQDGKNDLYFLHYHFVPNNYYGFVTSNGLAYASGFNGGRLVGAGSWVFRLDKSFVLDGQASFIRQGALAVSNSGSFAASRDGYVGFSFQDVNNGTHYGWLKVNMGDAGLNAFELVEYAFEDVAGKGIHVGSVPEPGSLGLLAAGALGLLLWRRARRGDKPAA